MHARGSVAGSPWAGSISAGASMGALIALIAKRLSLGIDVAAAKFVGGEQVDDPVREEEILVWVANRPPGGGVGSAARVDFFSDQIAANKVIQRGLHEHWRQDPAGFPRSRCVTAEIRPRLDIVNRHMLLLLPRIPRLSPEQLSTAADTLYLSISSRSSLRPLDGVCRTAVHTALRSLGNAG